MSKEYNGISYMLIVKDQTNGHWHLLKKFLLIESGEQLCGSYISSSWYQEKVADETEPIEYFLICIDSNVAISDIINNLMSDINHTQYTINGLLEKFNYLYNIWHFKIPENSYNTEYIELTPKHFNNITLQFSMREINNAHTNSIEKYISTPQMVLDM